MASPRLLALFLAAALAAGPAMASEKKKADPAAGRATDGAFDLSPVAMPVIAGGRVMNYVFVTVRLIPVSIDKTSTLKTKEPFLRDALVRAAHRTPFTLPYDYNKLDERRIAAAMMAAIPAIAGGGQVKAVVVSKQQPKNIRRSPKPPTK